MDIVKKIIKDSSIEKRDIKLLGNRYYLLEKISTGGFSDIYNAIDVYSQYFENNSNIVIKIPKEEYLNKNDIDAFLYSEYKILKSLSLDTIIKVLDFGIDGKIPYLVFEKIDGRLFSEINFAYIDIKIKNQIYKELKNTISYIHSKNIIHADISPTNIFLNTNNKIILFDFGFSFKKDNTYSFSLDYSKNKILNIRYMSPKLFENKEQISKKTDIFSLCVVLYEMYTNKILFSSHSCELYEMPVSIFKMKNIPFLRRFWFKKILQKAK